jgi:hypothetical protein
MSNPDFLHYGLRVALIAVSLVLWFWTQALISRKTAHRDGLGDASHDWTSPLNDWLTRHPRTADCLLIISSGFIDVFGLYLIAASIFGPTLRPFIAMIALYTLRQVCQSLCTLPAPLGMIWRQPGVPSLLVTYGTSNDFFFSGHTAIAVLGALELAQHGIPLLTAAAATIAVLEAATVLTLRAHYTMDVFAAAVAAWCAEDFAGWAAPFVDAWLT